MTETRAMSIRGIDPQLYSWLKIRAAEHDRSMEAEARAIFEEVKRTDETGDESRMSLSEYLRPLVTRYGGIDGLELPSRDEYADGFDFSDWDVKE